MTEYTTEVEVKKLAQCLIGKTIRLITMNKEKSVLYFQQLDMDNNYVVLKADDNDKMIVKDITMSSGTLSGFYESHIIDVDYSRVTIDGEDMDIYTLITDNKCTLIIKCDIRYSDGYITPMELESKTQWLN